MSMVNCKSTVLVEGHNPEVVILLSFQNDEESQVRIAANECGGVLKSLLAGRGRTAFELWGG